MDSLKTGNYIALKRKEAGITQKELAEKLMISDKAVSRWETGRGLPDIDMFIPLSEALGVSVSELMTGESQPGHTEAADRAAVEGVHIAERTLTRRKRRAALAGLLAALILFILAAVHLNAPIFIDDPSCVSVEKLSDGRIIAVLGGRADGLNVYSYNEGGVTIFHLSGYHTRWNDLTGREENKAVVLGDPGERVSVFYYPTKEGDKLIYGEWFYDGTAGVETLPRLVYNYWIIIGGLLTAVTGAGYALLRKKYAGRIMGRAFLLSLSFTLAVILSVVLYRGMIYDASYFFSGILLLTAALFALANIAAGAFMERKRKDQDA